MQKKILVVNADTLFPPKAMNQVRAINMINSLSKEFHVDLTTLVKNPEEIDCSVKGMAHADGNFIPIESLKSDKSLLRKRYSQAVERIGYYLLGLEMDYLYSKQYYPEILKTINEGKYDIVISHYWTMAGFFKHLSNDIIKILDTHYAVEENIKLNEQGKYGSGKTFARTRELKKSLELEQKFMRDSDIIVSLSKSNSELFSKTAPDKAQIMIPDGNDVKKFLSAKAEPERSAIIFYGNMSSNQNITAFFRYYNELLPAIKAEVPDVKTIVIGANPGKEIQALHNGKDIVVTGFVDDPRKYLKKGVFLILPMTIGSGFRGRIVEVMAMGIPVVGSVNALESIEMESGKQGYISDDNNEMIRRSVSLLKDEALRKKMSEECVKFVETKYSLEATFDKFTSFLVNYVNNNK